VFFITKLFHYIKIKKYNIKFERKKFASSDYFFFEAFFAAGFFAAAFAMLNDDILLQFPILM